MLRKWALWLRIYVPLWCIYAITFFMPALIDFVMRVIDPWLQRHWAWLAAAQQSWFPPAVPAESAGVPAGIAWTILAASVALLGLSITLIVVAYSVGDLDRVLVRTLVLRSVPTSRLLWYYAGLIVTSAVESVRSPESVAVPCALVIGFAGGVIQFVLYYNWFLRALDFKRLEWEVKRRPFPPTELVQMLAPTLRMAVAKSTQDNAAALLSLFVKTAVELENQTSVKDLPKIREHIQRVLLESAREAIRLRNDTFLDNLNSTAHSFLGSLDGERRDYWYQWLSQKWVPEWHHEFLAGQYRHSGGFEFCIGYLRLLLGQVDDTLDGTRRADRRRWLINYRNALRVGLQLLMLELNWMANDLHRYEEGHLREVFWQYQRLLEWTPHGQVSIGELRSRLYYEDLYYAVAIVYLVFSALLRGEQAQVMRVLQMADSLMTQMPRGIDPLFEALAKEEMELTWLNHWFGLDRIKAELQGLAAYTGLGGLALNIVRRITTPIQDDVLVPRILSRNILALSALTSGLDAGMSRLCSVFGSRLVNKVRKEYETHLNKLAEQGGATQVEELNQWLPVVAEGFSRVPLTRTGPISDGTLVQLREPIPQWSPGGYEWTTSAFAGLGEKLGHKALERLLREILYVEQDWLLLMHVKSTDVTAARIRQWVRKAQEIGLEPGLVLTSAPIAISYGPCGSAEGAFACVDGLPVYSIMGHPESKPGVTLLIDNSYLQKLGMGGLDVAVAADCSELILTCRADWSTGYRSIRGIRINHQ